VLTYHIYHFQILVYSLCKSEIAKVQVHPVTIEQHDNVIGIGDIDLRDSTQELWSTFESSNETAVHFLPS
jgi:hypothetical protein